MVPYVIVVACVLAIIALTPSMIVDPLAKAFAQIRQNAARSQVSDVSSQNTENPYPEETLVPKAPKK